ncbi:MAG: DMT family transporter [Trueperaceae bacterium]|nr:DMT family transporter [Trueperaceae bacterium]
MSGGAAGGRPLLGDGLALTGAAAAGAYLLLGRHAQAHGLGLQAYAGSAYAVAALVLAPLPLVVGAPYLGYPSATYLAVIALALVPQLVGHTGINYAAKHLDTTLVASALLLEPIGAGLLALLLFREQPAPLTVVGAAVLLVGVAVTSRAQAQRRPRAREARAAGR